MTASATDTARVKAAARQLEDHADFLLAPTALYFSATSPADAVRPASGSWTCMFRLMPDVQAGQLACFSAANPGCVGAASYLGFSSVPVVPAAIFLSQKERLKKDARLAAAFYNGVGPLEAAQENLVFQRLDGVPDDSEVEVVNLWVGAAALSSLHSLANYDRADNENVIMPFGSGCQSIWTLPYKEKFQASPRAVVGSLDPTVRRYLPAEAISFSLPAPRFVEMCANIQGSFMTLGKNRCRHGGRDKGAASLREGAGGQGAGHPEDGMEVLAPAGFNARLMSAILKYFAT